MVVMIEMAHAVRMRFGEGRHEHGTCECAGRQNLHDAVHGTLPDRSAADSADTGLTPADPTRCTSQD
ncbi:hypothetical protein Bcep1808_4121 [Burkholderia vietnamiensis G4]|uniref:Uncharacterized protein n=1 Tax=Burkholderia vietnamiensis (strain G4 / LMG 22486) TaxID=269482 RepID=A4JLE8_BURVG|nr:hypothetical protein Bcep1808_4121 [Burkholderia vietnamiensis G4]